MTLKNLLTIIDENSRVEIWAASDPCEPLAVYDGREAIPKDLNKREIVSVSAGYFKIDITIKD